MYQVKKAEKGYITEFDLELFTKNAKETEMRRLFHKMLNEELFTYYFQPIVSATDGSIYAYEALMRGNLPALTRPDQILQLAHEEECLHEIERLTMFLSANPMPHSSPPIRYAVMSFSLSIRLQANT